MIRLEKNKDISNYSTLACSSVADSYAELTDESQITDLLKAANANGSNIRVLGGGSNLVLMPTVSGVVVRNLIRGIELLATTQTSVQVKVGAGENWHDFVSWCVSQGFSGVENLALIPGTVGASPVQNIGAYGVEVSSVIEQVNAYDIAQQKFVSINKNDCDFSYRGSIFKAHEGRFIITSVVFKLDTQLKPTLNYGPLASLADDKTLSLQKIYEAVIAVRTEKLPDPANIPNAGSFFKNPIITHAEFERLQAAFPNVVNYPAGENQIKLAAGWLIDQAELKGQSNEYAVGCYSQQALVLVNPERADGNQVLNWADTVTQTVVKQFGVSLELEPRVWR